MIATQKRGVIVIAHPDPTSFNHALAARVASNWTAAGVETKVHDLHAERFDPVMTVKEHRGQASSDQLVLEHIADLCSSNVLAVIHPNCWGSPPAMMKGWIDRVFAANAANATRLQKS